MDEIITQDPGAAGGGDPGAAGEQPPASAGGGASAAEPTLQDVLARIEKFESSFRPVMGIQGRVAELQQKFERQPKDFETMLQKRFEDFQRTTLINQLSPEMRQQYEAQIASSQGLKQQIESAIREMLPGEMSWIPSVAQRAKDRFEAEDFHDRIEEAVGPEQMKKVGPIIGTMLKEYQKNLRSTDPDVQEEAKRWYQRAMQAPESVALQALNKLQEQVAQNGTQVLDERKKAGSALAATPRGSAPMAPKSLNGMNQAQLDQLAASMPTAEFEKLVRASKG